MYGPELIAAASLYCAASGVAAANQEPLVQTPTQQLVEVLGFTKYFTVEQLVRMSASESGDDPRSSFLLDCAHDPLLLLPWHGSQESLMECVKQTQELFLSYDLFPTSGSPAVLSSACSSASSSPSNLQEVPYTFAPLS